MDRKPHDGAVDTLIRKISEISTKIEKMNLAEYVEFMETPRRVLYANFLAGIARGFGFAIGATVLAALFLYVLSRTVELNLPIIGKFIAEIVKIVHEQLGRR